MYKMKKTPSIDIGKPNENRFSVGAERVTLDAPEWERILRERDGARHQRDRRRVALSGRLDGGVLGDDERRLRTLLVDFGALRRLSAGLGGPREVFLSSWRLLGSSF